MSRLDKFLVLVFLGAVFLAIAAIVPVITSTVQTLLAQIGMH